jgi:hypothetical protein
MVRLHYIWCDDTFFTNGRQRPFWTFSSTFFTWHVQPKCVYHHTKQDCCWLERFGFSVQERIFFFTKLRMVAILDFSPPFCTVHILFIHVYYFAYRHCSSLNGLASGYCTSLYLFIKCMTLEFFFRVI